MLIRRTTMIVALVGAEVVSLVLLMRLGSYSPGPPGWGRLGSWLSDTPPEDALVAAVRLLALGLSWWLTASTALYGLGRLTQVPALIRGVRWVTLPPLRRVIDGMVATTVVASTTFGGGRVAMAQPVPVGPVVVQLDQQADPPPEVATSKPAYQPRPAGDGSGRADAARGQVPDDPEVPASVPPPEGGSWGSHTTRHTPASGSTTTTTMPAEPSPTSVGDHQIGEASRASNYIVERGDNLWKIAQREVAAATGQSVATISAAQVGGYWVQLVETNRHLIRSENPDLIYPGEAISLPPLSSDTQSPSAPPRPS